MIADSFDSRTLANMEVALDRACRLLHSGAEQHKTVSLLHDLITSRRPGVRDGAGDGRGVDHDA
jgi:hypothetical protein